MYIAQQGDRPRQCCKLVVNAMQSILYAINLLKSIQYVLLNGTTVRVWKEPERSMLPDY